MITLSLIVAIASASVQPEDPTLILNPANSTAEQVAPSSVALLSKARQIKLQGGGAFGEMYRRAAWAAAEEHADDPAIALDILDELLANPGSIFDAFDAHRIAGQLYSRRAQWTDSLARYEDAASLASQDPSLIDAHPLLYVSIMQGAAAAAAQNLSFDAAALYATELRDHPSDRIPHRARRAAALSAARHFHSAGDIQSCTSAWEHVELLAPDLFEGRTGVHTRLERARAMATLHNNYTPIADLWWDGEIKSHDTAIVVALQLANRLATESDPDLESALAVLMDAWFAIQTHEQTWLDSLDPEDLVHLSRHTRILLHRATDIALRLEDWNDALTLAGAYRVRFDSSTDQRGAAWVAMAQAGMNAGN